MARNAFLDPVTMVLKCHGLVESNTPGDIKIPVPDDFALDPGRWRWTGTTFVAHLPAPPAPSALARALDETVASTSLSMTQLRLLLIEWRKQVP